MMEELTPLLHYGSIMFIVALTSLGVGLSSGQAGLAAIEAINIQPSAKKDIMRATIIGLALIETSAILALIVALLLMGSLPNLIVSIAEVGIAAAIGITGLVIGYVSSFPVQATCYALARQPFFAQRIINIMLITQSIIQTPLIFGFLISLLILMQAKSASSIAQGIPLLASGLCLGLGSIGPAYGLAHFARIACKSVSLNRRAYNQIVPFTFMSEAIIETPLIFSFLISLILLGTAASATNDLSIIVIRSLAAALCIGIGTLGPGISSSKTAAQACLQIAMNPQQYSMLSQVSMFGQGLIDAAAVYALLISLFLVFIK